MKSLVLCSGGVKSSFLAVEASKESEAILLFLDHAQGCRAKEEAAVERIAHLYGCALERRKTVGFPSTEEPLLRFLCFACHAIPVAQKHQCQVIYHGLSRDDLPPAATAGSIEKYAQSLQALLNMSLPWYNGAGQWLGNIDIETPLRRIRMEHIIRLGNEWGIDWTSTWSCMRNGAVHCGECLKCLRRQAAFRREGHIAPTIYGK